jgi:hypothetical protein
LAELLICSVAAAIEERGDVPFLHAQPETTTPYVSMRYSGSPSAAPSGSRCSKLRANRRKLLSARWQHRSPARPPSDPVSPGSRRHPARRRRLSIPIGQ